jgi:INO80 complex subunit C
MPKGKQKKEVNDIEISIDPMNNVHHHSKHKHAKAPFKKANWISKFRSKDKARNGKSVKNIIQDSLDALSYSQRNIKIIIDLGIEAGPSLLPKKKYCDLTGFETTYLDPRSGLRYYNNEIFKIIQNISDPIKNQYLSIRKALFIIK